MRSRGVFLVGLAVACAVALGATTALGRLSVVLTASPAAVTYPQSATLSMSSCPTGAVISRMAGASEWTTYTNVSASDTTTVVPVGKPAGTTAYAFFADGYMSDPVTITVAAQMSKPSARSHGHRGHRAWIRGWVSPMHAHGHVQLAFYRWRKTTATKYGWVKTGGLRVVALRRLNSQKSLWEYRWKPGYSGTWKITVSHEDVAHVRSTASSKIVVRR